MFIGHFALGFAAKRAAPRASLAALFAAAQLADLLWPVLVAFGIEQVRIEPGNTAFTPLDFVSYPYSHSLLMLVVWSIVFAGVYRVPTIDTARAATVRCILAALVISHWVLDYVTHRPDMPLYPGGPRFGLGLWNSVPATVAIEVAMYLAGLWVYVRATRSRDAAGKWGFVALAVFLLIAYAGNILGGPPPSVTAIWTLGIVGGAILLVWSWWVDRHRNVILTSFEEATR
jgi:membrane-bound metal-dependent hydrolase YbcI (DUF457 family)